jgi:hypothetical protein
MPANAMISLCVVLVSLHVNEARVFRPQDQARKQIITSEAQPSLYEAFISTEVSEDAARMNASLPDIPAIAKEARDDFKRKCEVVTTVSDKQYLPVEPLKRFCETTDNPMECRLQVSMRLKDTYARDGDMGEFCVAVWEWFQSKYGEHCPTQCRKLQCRATCLWLEEKEEANEAKVKISEELKVAAKKMESIKELQEEINSKKAEEEKAKFTVSMAVTRKDRATKAVAEREADLKAGEAKLKKTDELVLDIKANITVIKDTSIKLEGEVTKQTFDLDKDKLKFEDMGRTAKRLMDKASEQVKLGKSFQEDIDRIAKQVNTLTKEHERVSKIIGEDNKKLSDLQKDMDDKIDKVETAWEMLKQFMEADMKEPSGSSWDEIAQKWIHGNYVEDDRVPETKELVENQYKRAKDAEAAYNEMKQRIKDQTEMSFDISRQLTELSLLVHRNFKYWKR